MKEIFFVGLGGLAGSVARYKLGGWILHRTLGTHFPWSTFAVNLIGCFAIGILAGFAERFDAIGPQARLFLFTGVLGGFTTFSAFGLETVNLLRRGEMLSASAYAAGSVACGVAVLWLALRAVQLLPR